MFVVQLDGKCQIYSCWVCGLIVKVKFTLGGLKVDCKGKVYLCFGLQLDGRGNICSCWVFGLMVKANAVKCGKCCM